jgi:hypothetical protein
MVIDRMALFPPHCCFIFRHCGQDRSGSAGFATDFSSSHLIPMSAAECRDGNDSMSASCPHDRLSSSGRQDENRTADSSPPLLSTNNVTGVLTPPRSSSECGQNQSRSAASVVTNFLTGPSSPSSWLRLKLTPTERDELEKCLPDEKFRGFR